MKNTEQHGGFVVSWEEPPIAALPSNHEWSFEISTEHPGLLKKLGGQPRRFRAPNREYGLAGARWFADSLSLI
ncbi:MAG: hypothetical protein ABSA66_18840 [Roseiarcus sp.]|jgi:hypothetical protein